MSFNEDITIKRNILKTRQKSSITSFETLISRIASKQLAENSTIKKETKNSDIKKSNQIKILQSDIDLPK